MAEIMYEINNSYKFKEFQKKEQIVRQLFRGLLIFIFGYGIIAFYINSQRDDTDKTN